MTDLPRGTHLARLDDLPDPGGRVVQGCDDLILVRRGNEIRCFENVCPHAGRALNLPDGRVFLHKGEHIICPVHGATFDADSGSCTGGPAGSPLKSVAIEVIEGDIRLA